MKYDYIIAGAGCAGLSLLYRILKDPKLCAKNILILDKDQKKKNDRTWCYWEKDAGIFEDIVHTKWNSLEFLSTNFEQKLNLGVYSYKMILGSDFYNFVLDHVKQHKNVIFKQEHIKDMFFKDDTVFVSTENNTFKGTYIFNSTPIFNPKINTKNSLLQHFTGWVIETENEAFNPKVGRLMDFRLSQENGDTFMYVLPTSKTTALVEYTLFSPSVLEKEKYDTALKEYITNHLKVTNYTIAHKEFGIIPMSLAKFQKKPLQNIINIGTAGGYTKASSGYTFQFIQKDVETIACNLKNNKSPAYKTSFRDRIYNWYDATLIEVLLSKKHTGKEIFTIMFQKVGAEKILAFLGNESTFFQDLIIMKSLPIKTFFLAGLKQLKIKKS